MYRSRKIFFRGLLFVAAITIGLSHWTLADQSQENPQDLETYCKVVKESKQEEYYKVTEDYVSRTKAWNEVKSSIEQEAKKVTDIANAILDKSPFIS